MKVAIWWIRRDIRLTDNQALANALDYADLVIPVFIFDPHILSSDRMSQKRNCFLKNSLVSLHLSLLSRNSQLNLYQGNPLLVLQNIVHQLQIEHQVKIFAEADFTPFSMQRDALIQQNLPLELVGSPAYYPPDTILKDDQSPYLIFTPYSKRWRSLPHLPPTKFTPPFNIPTYHFQSEVSIDELMCEFDPNFLPSEDEAKNKLEKFTSSSSTYSVYTYNQFRNELLEPTTSRLSPYLRFGLVSIRQVVHKALEAIQSASTEEQLKSAQNWLNELIWRDFYIQALYHFPNSLKHNLKNINIKWENSEDKFIAWKLGQTGIPVVDAIMRQLVAMGWISNRARMIVASFLVKDLLIDWRWGEKWFMQNLIDGDPASNVGGWQWCAGTGTDSAPFFRIINPITQSKKFDHDGKYIRKWVPELKFVPNEYIHEPHRMPENLQEKVKCVIGKDYPFPIIDHREARNRTLNAYRNVR